MNDIPLLVKTTNDQRECQKRKKEKQISKKTINLYNSQLKQAYYPVENEERGKSEEQDDDGSDEVVDCRHADIRSTLTNRQRPYETFQGMS